MTPFEIARTIRDRPDDDEPVRDFALRVLAQERAADFHAALELLAGWIRAYDDFEKLVAILRAGARKTPGSTIGNLIKHKRSLGYDPALETLLARRWRCPHCKQWATINKIALRIVDATRLLRCVTCGEEGIAPVDTEARLDVRDGGKSGLRPT